MGFPQDFTADTDALPMHVPGIINPLLLCWDESFFVPVQSGH